MSGQKIDRKDATVGTKDLGLHGSLCSFAANRTQRLIGTTTDPLV